MNQYFIEKFALKEELVRKHETRMRDHCTQETEDEEDEDMWEDMDDMGDSESAGSSEDSDNDM